MPAEQLLEHLGAQQGGLSGVEAQRRLKLYGANLLKPARRGPLLEAIVSQLRNPLLWLLSISAVLSGMAGETNDAVIVISIMVLGSLIAIVQESRAGHALETLKARISLNSRVLRDGREVEVPTASVVPGDVVLLAAGSLVAADAVVLQAKDLFLNEAALTGEPFAAQKFATPTSAQAALGARSNMVYLGTDVRSGTGRVLVVGTGAQTAFGGLASKLASTPAETEFSVGMRRFGNLLLKAMLLLAFVVFAASALRHHPRMEALLFAIALAVGLAPEMLPAVLSTMLSRGARGMAARGVLVRRLETIENLGCMNVLCTDKTGTLTEGEIRLEQALDVAGEPQPGVALLGYWNASLQAGLPNPLDRAIVEYHAAQQLGDDSVVKLDELPFDFARRRLSISVRAEGRDPMLITKGAFEAVLSVCTHARRGDTVEALDEGARQSLRARVDAWSEQGLRVLAVATRELSEDQVLELGAEREETLEGFMTFRDPPKQGVSQALKDLADLGIEVKVVSGDHHGVVGHLGAEIGLPSSRVVTGSELATLGEDALGHLVETVNLFAEIDPIQKERVLLAIKKRGHVVGFMGDGINDSPSIHAADVGISVAGATDVAREAADFVLLAQDLGILRDGIVEGRKIFANTMKYVLTTESANLGNMVSMAGAALFLPFLPLLAHQVLLNNLLSDIPSTTLSADRVDRELLTRPQRWDLAFLRKFMLGFGLISSAFDIATFLTLTWVFQASVPVFRTAWFVESLLTELLVLLVLRTRRRFWSSHPHPALLATTAAVIAVTVILPLSPLAGMLGFVSLPKSIWIAIFAIAGSYMLTVEMVKLPLLRKIGEAGTARKAAVS